MREKRKKITSTVINFREATREKKRSKNKTKRILERRTTRVVVFQSL